MGHMKFVTELALDEQELAEFRAAYKKAVKEKKKEYQYKNSWLYTEYAGHVLYYIDNHAENIKSEYRKRH